MYFFACWPRGHVARNVPGWIPPGFRFEHHTKWVPSLKQDNWFSSVFTSGVVSRPGVVVMHPPALTTNMGCQDPLHQRKATLLLVTSCYLSTFQKPCAWNGGWFLWCHQLTSYQSKPPTFRVAFECPAVDSSGGPSTGSRPT